MFCPSCGNELPTGITVKHCIHCGQKIQPHNDVDGDGDGVRVCKDGYFVLSLRKGIPPNPKLFNTDV